MSPRCTCNKFGDCSWFKPASCVKINPENGKCKLDEAPIGKFDCTGNSAGDLCLLQCPVPAEGPGCLAALEDQVFGRLVLDLGRLGLDLGRLGLDLDLERLDLGGLGIRVSGVSG